MCPGGLCQPCPHVYSQRRASVARRSAGGPASRRLRRAVKSPARLDKRPGADFEVAEHTQFAAARTGPGHRSRQSTPIPRRCPSRSSSRAPSAPTSSTNCTALARRAAARAAPAGTDSGPPATAASQDGDAEPRAAGSPTTCRSSRRGCSLSPTTRRSPIVPTELSFCKRLHHGRSTVRCRRTRRPRLGPVR